MVNVRFSNYDDFLKFVKGVPDNVKRILYRAYPEYTKRLMDDVSKAFNSHLISTGKKEQPKITENKQPRLTTTKTTGSTAAPKINKTLSNLNKAAKGIGAVAKRVAPAVAAIGEVGNITNPNNPMKSRVLSGAGAILPFVGGPIGWGGGIAAMLGSATLRNADQWANDRANKDFEAYQERYGSPEFPRAYDQAPGLAPLTPEQQDQVLKYQQKQIEADFANMEQQVKQQKQDMKDLIARNEASQANTDNIANDLAYAIDSLNNAPTGVRGYVPPIRGSAPVQSNNQTRGVQNAQQPRLNGSQVLTGGDVVNSPYNALQLAQDLSQQNRLAAIENFNQLQTLINQEGNNNMAMNAPVPNQGQASPAMSAYLEAMALQREQDEANRLAQQQFYQQALQGYQAAVEADRKANAINQVGNALSQIQGPYDRPIQYVGFNGQVRTVGGYPARLSQAAPTNTTRNVDHFKNVLALQEAAQLANQKNQSNNNLEALRDVVVAEALGNQYGMNPMAFLNPDLAKQLLTNQGNIENTRVTGEERRKDILPSTLGKLIEQQAETAGDIDLANVEGMYGLQGRDITGQYGVEQAKVQGLNNYQNQFMQQQFLNQRLQAELLARAQQTEREIQGRLAVAQQYGMNQRDLAAYEQQLRANDPMQAIKNAIQYTNAASYYVNPDDAARMYYQALQMFGGNNNQQQPTVLPNIGANLTPQQQAAILKRMK